ncbi:MAG: hypothetical protein LBJ14_09780, partial [Desulfarculales bacterium]|nr:hypothetical protein [Desulfarculales bacterium]
IKVLSGDERARALAEAREKARMDFEDNYNGAYKEGEQKGRLEGILEGEQKGRLEGEQKGRLEGKMEGIMEGKMEERQEVAANALRENIPVETVARLTGLPLAEVKQIAARLDLSGNF